MPIERPKLFLDTDICIKVANQSIDSAEWRRVQKCIATNYRYCISFITLKELFGKLARGSGAYFEQNKKPLRVLYEPAERTFLQYPTVFALRTVLGIEAAGRIVSGGLAEEVWASTVLRAVLDAPSKQHLKQGIKRNGYIESFDLDHFDTHENRPQSELVNILQGVRDGTVDVLEPKKTAEILLLDHGIKALPQDCEKMADDLDAAFRLHYSLSSMANDMGYDFNKHESDWGDLLQLFYLCDHSMHFLTWDADFRNRTKGSRQSARILLYPEFLRSLPR